MVRKRVIATFLGLIVFTGLVLFISLANENNITGFGATDFTDQDSFSLIINDYSINKNFVDLYYSIKDNVNGEHKVKINYFVHDDALKIIKSGEESLILNPAEKGNYKLSFVLNDKPDGEYYATLVADDGFSEKRASLKLFDYQNFITGQSVRNFRIESVNYFLVMLLFLFIIFYCARAIYSYRIKRKLEKVSSNGRFIDLGYRATFK